MARASARITGPTCFAFMNAACPERAAKRRIEESMTVGLAVAAVRAAHGRLDHAHAVAVSAGWKKKLQVAGVRSIDHRRTDRLLSGSSPGRMPRDRITHKRSELLVGNLRHFYRSS